MRTGYLDLLLALPVFALLAGCAARPLPPVQSVDLQRFMGDWYVIAAIPTFLERGAYNAVESYSLRSDGRVQTHYRHRKDRFDGPLKTFRPVGTVRPESGNGLWGMQFVWPVKAEYVIAWLDPEYRSVIVGRSRRDYVWIMARTPRIDEAAYQGLVARVAAMGYDRARLRRVPQRWPEP
jgi:apolipoprotein D and lipocalin family protein